MRRRARCAAGRRPRSGCPSARSRPRRSRPVGRSITMASRAVWVTTMLTPSNARRCSRSCVRSAIAPAASSEAVGSSSSSIRGSLASARAMATRCACPPESSRGLRSARSAIASRSSQASRGCAALLARYARTRVARTRRCRARVRCGKSRWSWKTKPTSVRVVGTCDVGTGPGHAADADLARRRRPTSPASARSVVDLPAPLGPIRPMTSPGVATSSTVVVWLGRRTTKCAAKAHARDAGDPALAQQGQHHDRHGDQHETQRDARSRGPR